jgi:hypothetical protein
VVAGALCQPPHIRIPPRNKGLLITLLVAECLEHLVQGQQAAPGVGPIIDRDNRVPTLELGGLEGRVRNKPLESPLHGGTLRPIPRACFFRPVHGIREARGGIVTSLISAQQPTHGLSHGGQRQPAPLPASRPAGVMGRTRDLRRKAITAPRLARAARACATTSRGEAVGGQAEKHRSEDPRARDRRACDRCSGREGAAWPWQGPRAAAQ